MFEEEYKDVISNLQIGMGEDDYMKYLSAISADKTHAGYFSIDKKVKMIYSKANEKRENSKEKMSNDVDAYDLIMKNKELLLIEIRRSLLCVLSSHIQHFVKDGIILMCFRFVL